MKSEWPFINYRAPNEYDRVFIDPEGQIWTRDQSCSGSYPNQRCSCVVTSVGETKEEVYKIDIPDSSCNNVIGITSDQAGKLWVTFKAGLESQFGLASYTEQKWTFYETGDIPDPLLKPDRWFKNYGMRYLVPDFNGDLWLSSFNFPYVVRINPTSANLTADPVPDSVILTRKISNTSVSVTGTLFIIFALIAAWSSYLNSKAGISLAQRMREKSLISATPSQPSPRISDIYKSRRRSILAAGTISVLYYFLFLRFATSMHAFEWHRLASVILPAFFVISFALGAGSAVFVSYGSITLKRRYSPTMALYGFIILILGVLAFVASFIVILGAVGFLISG